MKPFDCLNARKASESGASLIVTLLIASAVSVIAIGSLQALDGLSFFTKKTLKQSDADSYNRAALMFFKDRWEEGQVRVTLTSASLDYPPMIRTAAAVGGNSSAGSWQMVEIGTAPNIVTEFHVRRCPNTFDLSSGGTLSPWTATNEDCVAKGTAIVTTIRSVSLNKYRTSAIFEATTKIATTESKLKAAMIIPQSHDQVVCGLKLNNIEQSAVSIPSGGSVKFTLDFSPTLVSGVEYTIDSVTKSVPASALTSSPYEFTETFVGKATPYNVKFRTFGGPSPCEPSASVAVDIPPPPPSAPPSYSCKWAEPGYKELLPVTGCAVHAMGHRLAPLTRIGTIMNVPVGMNEGTKATISPSNNDGALAGCAESTECRMVVVPNGRAAFNNGTSSTYANCQQNSRGIMPYNVSETNAYILQMFKTTKGQCQVKLVVARNSIDGCLLPTAQVRMKDGTVKQISEIAVGDEVWNPILQRGVKVLATRSGPEKNPLIEVKTSRLSLVMTELHPVKTSSGFVAAKDLKPGDTLISDMLVSQRIESIKLKPMRNQIVWNLILDPTEDQGSVDAHFFIADHVVVGDWQLQDALVQEAMRSDPKPAQP